MTLHSSTYKGKRVFIVLKSGEKHVDKFLDKKSNHIHLETLGKIRKQDIKCMTIYRNNPLSPEKQALNKKENHGTEGGT